MEKAANNNVDPGFWIGLVMIALLLLVTYKCH